MRESDEWQPENHYRRDFTQRNNHMKHTPTITRLVTPKPIEIDEWNPIYDWHNPLKLLPEQVGVKNGWRLALKSEVVDPKRPLFNKCQGRLGEDSNWPKDDRYDCEGTVQAWTYRTKEPLPEIEMKLIRVCQFDKGCSQGNVNVLGEWFLPYDEVDIDKIYWLSGCCTPEFSGEKVKIGYVTYHKHKFIIMQAGKIEKPHFYDGKAEADITLHGDFKP